MNDEILESEEASMLTKLSVVKLLAMARSGEIPAIELGNRWLFVRDQLLCYLSERAISEQINRKSMFQSKPDIKQPQGSHKKPGRPTKKIDLSKYTEANR